MKMEKEFNLSEKEIVEPFGNNGVYWAEDVKEFIKRLKECFGISIIGNKPYTYTAEMIYKQIDKLAGDRLCLIECKEDQ